MTAQKREAGKNYIGLLSDELETPHTALPAPGDRPIKNYLLDLMASWLNRRHSAR